MSLACQTCHSLITLPACLFIHQQSLLLVLVRVHAMHSRNVYTSCSWCVGCVCGGGVGGAVCLLCVCVCCVCLLLCVCVHPLDFEVLCSSPLMR